MSTSANAGKVMLGADGCVLRGHDGKIVLADDIYPMRPRFAGSYYVRQAIHSWDDGVKLENPVWGATWSHVESSLPENFAPLPGSYSPLRYGQLYYPSVGLEATVWNATQHVARWDFSEVDMNRVAKIRISNLVWSVSREELNIPFKFYYASAGATLPSGTNAPWSGTGWTLLTSTVGTTRENKYYEVIEIEPTSSFLFAAFPDIADRADMLAAGYPADGDWDAHADADRDFGGEYGGITYPSVYGAITYNLAT